MCGLHRGECVSHNTLYVHCIRYASLSFSLSHQACADLRSYVQSRLENCKRGWQRFEEETKRFSEDLVLKSVANNSHTHSSKGDSSALEGSNVGRSQAISGKGSSFGGGNSARSKGSFGDFDGDDDPDQQMIVKLRNDGKYAQEVVLHAGDDEEEGEGEGDGEGLTMAQRLQRQADHMKAMRRMDAASSKFHRSASSSSKGQMILGTLKDTADTVVFYK